MLSRLLSVDKTEDLRLARSPRETRAAALRQERLFIRDQPALSGACEPNARFLQSGCSIRDNISDPFCVQLWQKRGEVPYSEDGPGNLGLGLIKQNES